MPAPLPYFRPNEPAFPQLNAERLNAIVSAVRNIPGRQRTNVPESLIQSRTECYVRNSTSAAYPIHSVLAINNAASAAVTLTSDQDKIDFNDEPVFNVNVPVASTDFPFILLEPLAASGGIARAAIGGIAVCTVNITDTGHEYANPTAGDHTKLTSGSTGQVRIIHKPTGTGDKTCAVYLVEASGATNEYGHAWNNPFTLNVFGVLGTLFQVEANSTLKAMFHLHIEAHRRNLVSQFNYIYREVYWAWNVPPYTPIGGNAERIRYSGPLLDSLQFSVPAHVVLENTTGTARSAIFVLSNDIYDGVYNPPYSDMHEPAAAGVYSWGVEIYQR